MPSGDSETAAGSRLRKSGMLTATGTLGEQGLQSDRIGVSLVDNGERSIAGKSVKIGSPVTLCLHSLLPPSTVTRGLWGWIRHPAAGHRTSPRTAAGFGASPRRYSPLPQAQSGPS